MTTDSTTDTTVLDLSDVIVLLQAALAEAQDLEATEVVFDRDVKANRPAVAVVTRKLMVLQHYAERAAVETEALVWTVKGFPDPLNAG